MDASKIALTIIFTTLAIIILVTVIVITVARSHLQQIQASHAKLAYEAELRQIESEVQEATLSHIAEELHDNIGQLLSVMNFQLEKEKLQYPEEEPRLKPVTDTLQSTIQQVRLLSHSLSSELVSAGLVGSIAQEVQRLRDIGKYQIHYTGDGIEPEIPKDARTVTFRIFQESINNALKHAKAKNIYIELKGEEVFLLQVRDDGKGFDKEGALNASKGLGLRNMVRRAALAGLACEIDSAEGIGTSLKVSVAHNNNV